MVAITPKKYPRQYQVYISRLLKTISDNALTNNAKNQLNSALVYLTEYIGRLAISLTLYAGKLTVSVKEVGNATRLFLPNEYHYILARGERAVELFAECQNVEFSTRQEKAGIIFPVSVTERIMRTCYHSSIVITKTAPIYLTAVIENITGLILTSACHYAQENNHMRITIRDLFLGVHNTSSLLEMWKKARITYVGGGVIPFIHPILLIKPPRRKKEESEKPRRYRPGTIALRQIKRYQKMFDCLFWPKKSFEYLVRRCLHEMDNGKKISLTGLILFQYYCEHYITEILQLSNDLAVHAERTRVLPTDIQLALKLRRTYETA